MHERPRILSVGTAHPPERYTQAEVLARFAPPSPEVRALFQSAHIRTRHLYLPPADADGQPAETQAELLQKHRRGALDMASRAIPAALDPLGLKPEDVDYLCVISSTGFMLPGLSAMFIRHFGFRVNCQRADIVGMGCNAGLNGLNPVVGWAALNPGRVALMICCEVNSALYIHEDNVSVAVVNSLFGDGCAAAVVRAVPPDEPAPLAPQVLDFESHLIPETWAAMHYTWAEAHGKFSFVLDRDVPYVLGTHAATPVGNLLARHGLKRRHIAHWLVHSGGMKVIDAIKYTVGVTAHDLRHTTGVLRDCGNLGSGSFLFSLRRLTDEGGVRRGDLGVMMTMGPGSTIETALLRW